MACHGRYPRLSCKRVQGIEPEVSQVKETLNPEVKRRIEGLINGSDEQIDAFIKENKNSQDPIDRLLLHYLYVRTQDDIQNIIESKFNLLEDMQKAQMMQKALRPFANINIEGQISENLAKEILEIPYDSHEKDLLSTAINQALKLAL